MQADRSEVARLLKTARGQIDGIIRMVEDDRYCIDIANQIMATQAILSKTNKLVLSAHMHGCVREAVKSGDSEYFREPATITGSGTGFWEAPRGALSYLVVGNGTQMNHRVSIHVPSFKNTPTVPHMLRGNTVADAGLIIASIDPCFSCLDR